MKLSQVIGTLLMLRWVLWNDSKLITEQTGEARRISLLMSRSKITVEILPHIAIGDL